jgi:acyl carrier protein
MYDVRQIVIGEITEVFKEEGVVFNDTLLSQGVMEVGVDSLTYAVLVARLESKIGRDPFTENPQRGYPRILSDFVDAYLE